MSSTVEHSGMKFINENIFHIENAPQYIKINENIKTVEFVRSKGNNLLFVEAKSSFANPNKPTSVEAFGEEISDICDKFTHSLNLYSAINIGVTEDGFPEEYFVPDKVKLRFFLVINGFKKSWCNDIGKALTENFKKSICMSKIWKPEIFVINDIDAAKHKLIES